MAVIGGFRSDLSITRNDGNFGNISAGVCFPKSSINENSCIKSDQRGSPIGLAGCGIWLFFAVIFGI